MSGLSADLPQRHTHSQNFPATKLYDIIAGKESINSDDGALSMAAFSALYHLIKRARLQSNTALLEEEESYPIIPLLIEKLGHSKSVVRSIARKSLQEFVEPCRTHVERAIREIGLPSENEITQIESLRFLLWLLNSKSTMSFKPFTAILTSLLNSENDEVRQDSSLILTQYFASASNVAKIDLYRELQRLEVEPDLASEILKNINFNPTPNYGELNNNPPSSRHSHPASHFNQKLQPVIKTSNNRVASLPIHSAPHSQQASKSRHKENSVGVDGIPDIVRALPGYEMEEMEEEYVRSSDELSIIMEGLLVPFAGKESEFNWQQREKNIIRMRYLIRGNAAKDFPGTLTISLKYSADGINKAIISLRTTLSTHGCQLIKDCATVLKTNFDSLTDIFIPTLIKLTAGSKKISAQNAHAAVSTIIAQSSYQMKIVNQISYAMHDKNFQPRLFAATWIRIVLACHGHAKNQIEHSGGQDVIEECLVKGLIDANPNVREDIRPAFWLFYEIWPQKAQAIIEEKLDSSKKKALERSRPEQLKSLPEVYLGERPTTSRAGSRGSRPPIRDFINKAKEAQGIIGREKANQTQSRTQPHSAYNYNLNQNSGHATSVAANHDKYNAHNFQNNVSYNNMTNVSRSSSSSSLTNFVTSSLGSHGKLVSTSTRLGPPQRVTSSGKPFFPVRNNSLRSSSRAGTPLESERGKTPIPPPTLMDLIGSGDLKSQIDGARLLESIFSNAEQPRDIKCAQPLRLPPAESLSPVLQRLFKAPKTTEISGILLHSDLLIREVFKFVPFELLAIKIFVMDPNSNQVLVSTIKSLAEKENIYNSYLNVLKGITKSSYSQLQIKRVIHHCLDSIEEQICIEEGVFKYDQKSRRSKTTFSFLQDANNYDVLTRELLNIAVFDGLGTTNHEHVIRILVKLGTLNMELFIKILHVTGLYNMFEQNLGLNDMLKQKHRERETAKNSDSSKASVDQLPVIGSKETQDFDKENFNVYSRDNVTQREGSANKILPFEQDGKFPYNLSPSPSLILNDDIEIKDNDIEMKDDTEINNDLEMKDDIEMGENIEVQANKLSNLSADMRSFHDASFTQPCPSPDIVLEKAIVVEGIKSGSRALNVDNDVDMEDVASANGEESVVDDYFSAISSPVISDKLNQETSAIDSGEGLLNNQEVAYLKEMTTQFEEKNGHEKKMEEHSNVEAEENESEVKDAQKYEEKDEEENEEKEDSVIITLQPATMDVSQDEDSSANESPQQPETNELTELTGGFNQIIVDELKLASNNNSSVENTSTVKNESRLPVSSSSKRFDVYGDGSDSDDDRWFNFGIIQNQFYMSQYASTPTSLSQVDIDLMISQLRSREIDTLKLRYLTAFIGSSRRSANDNSDEALPIQGKKLKDIQIGLIKMLHSVLDEYNSPKNIQTKDPEQLLNQGLLLLKQILNTYPEIIVNNTIISDNSPCGTVLSEVIRVLLRLNTLSMPFLIKSFILTGIQETAHKVVQIAHEGDLIDELVFILTMSTSLNNHDESTCRTIIMLLSLIQKALSKVRRGQPDSEPHQQMLAERVAPALLKIIAFAKHHDLINSENTNIRKLMVDVVVLTIALTSPLYEKETIFELLELKPNQRSLITYILDKSI
ncbi:hypothetical protein NADFUDRAFT_52553 [Nadsonia fulvescens var. elongata DSM 6958]|uniref:Protein STU1 n=1 Tax=Nadsonia fulvescens var. elongata DSM 6958 TaxID=857566 RepID=A0A1E3PFX7_9ASCO|nr:hypothetical protein NADFUDRAFT_52553 [Nadsonia fulvescens var. elongata DSM 6958]